MKSLNKLKLAGVTAAALASSSLLAEIELTKEFGLSGYAVGSASYTSVEGGSDDSNLDMDAFKLTGVAKLAPVTVTTSLFAFGTGEGTGLGGSPVFLDAYGTFDAGNGTTVTAGKFLSWLGYEAFDPVNMLQISYANTGTTGFIPAYHTGVKIENSTDTYTIGVAVLDSVYGPTYYKGDGDLDNGVGLEAYFTYKGIKDFTLFGGLAYDTGDDSDTKAFTADLWAQYVSGAFTYAAEICYGSKDYAVGSADGYFLLGLVRYQVDEKWATTFRLSTGEGVDKDDFVRATIAPSYTVTKNLEVVTEYSYTDYEDVGLHYLGVQARFKF